METDLDYDRRYSVRDLDTGATFQIYDVNTGEGGYPETFGYDGSYSPYESAAHAQQAEQRALGLLVSSPNVFASLVRHLQLRDEKGAFTAYEIHVEAVTPPNEPYLEGGTWIVHRRYNDFRSLHELLKRRGYRMANFPGRGRVLGLFSSDFLNKRQSALESWLLSVLHLPGALDLAELRTFLGDGAMFTENGSENNQLSPNVYVEEDIPMMMSSGKGISEHASRTGTSQFQHAQKQPHTTQEHTSRTLQQQAQAQGQAQQQQQQQQGGKQSTHTVEPQSIHQQPIQGGSAALARRGTHYRPPPQAPSSGKALGRLKHTGSSGRMRKRIGLEDFDLIKVIGKGSFGKVLMVRKKDDSRVLAMKVLSKPNVVKRKQVEHTKTERRVLGHTKHPFLVQLHYAFQTRDKLYLVLDYCGGGELFFHLGRLGRFKESMTVYYTSQLVMALGHLHAHGIVYRDLKPENVLLDSNGSLKLADFGLSKEGITDAAEGTKSFCGTPEYLAPEILDRKGHGTAVDWWSLGMLVYEMLTGLPPWYTRDRRQLYESLRSAPLEFPGFVSREAENLLRGLLTRDPKKRLGANGDAEEIKAHPFFRGIDWTRLLANKIAPPFVPRLRQGSVDTRYFDDQFTKLPADVDMSDKDNVADRRSASELGRSWSGNNLFTGFTYDGSAGELRRRASSSFGGRNSFVGSFGGRNSFIGSFGGPGSFTERSAAGVAALTLAHQPNSNGGAGVGGAGVGAGVGGGSTGSNSVEFSSSLQRRQISGNGIVPNSSLAPGQVNNGVLSTGATFGRTNATSPLARQDKHINNKYSGQGSSPQQIDTYPTDLGGAQFSPEQGPTGDELPSRFSLNTNGGPPPRHPPTYVGPRFVQSNQTGYYAPSGHHK